MREPMNTLLDATKPRDKFGDPIISGILRIQVHVDSRLGRLHEMDRQLWFLTTHTMLLTDRPAEKLAARVRREHAIAFVTYVWLRRETENPAAMVADIEALAALGRTERWKATVRTWALIAAVDPEMFMQYSTYTAYAAD
jgi:hypothetical protein